MRKGIMGVFVVLAAVVLLAGCTDSEPVDFEITSAQVGSDGMATFKVVFNKTVNVDSAMVTSPEDSVTWLFNGGLTQDAESLPYIVGWKDAEGAWYAPTGTYKIEAWGAEVSEGLFNSRYGEEFYLIHEVTIE
ncbi:hypothetical protein JXM67_02250 [candidate division WOR-3 bacterium]|nr:hypothetical protein [candidate division WOR-3 bacterium]